MHPATPIIWSTIWQGHADAAARPSIAPSSARGGVS